METRTIVNNAGTLLMTDPPSSAPESSYAQGGNRATRKWRGVDHGSQRLQGHGGRGAAHAGVRSCLADCGEGATTGRKVANSSATRARAAWASRVRRGGIVPEIQDSVRKGLGVAGRNQQARDVRLHGLANRTGLAGDNGESCRHRFENDVGDAVPVTVLGYHARRDQQVGVAIVRGHFSRRAASGEHHVGGQVTVRDLTLQPRA